MSDIQFVPGLIVKQRASNAPEYVIGKLSINIDQLKDWLSGRDGEWVNIDLKIAKSGKAYAAVDNWKPQGGATATRPANNQYAGQRGKPTPQGSGFDDMGDDIPF